MPDDPPHRDAVGAADRPQRGHRRQAERQADPSARPQRPDHAEARNRGQEGDDLEDLDCHHRPGLALRDQVGADHPGHGADDRQHRQHDEERRHPLPLLVEQHRDQGRRDRAQPDREREDQERHQRGGSHQRPLAAASSIRAYDGRRTSPMCLADLGGRDVGEVVGEVVEAELVGAEDAGEEEVVPAPRREAGDRADPQREAEAEDLAGSAHWRH